MYLYSTWASLVGDCGGYVATSRFSNKSITSDPFAKKASAMGGNISTTRDTTAERLIRSYGGGF